MNYQYFLQHENTFLRQEAEVARGEHHFSIWSVFHPNKISRFHVVL